MKFTDLFVRRPVLAAVVSLLILLIGLRAAFELPVRQYPELKNTVIRVSTSYPGAPAELMQGFITTPISQAVATAEGIDYMTASSAQGQSTVTAYVRLNYDPNVAMTDVMAKVQQVKYQIPQEANDPVILKSTGDTTAVMYMGFSSPELTGPAITDYLNSRRPAPARDRSGSGAGRDPGRPAIRDADLARSGPVGRTRHLGCGRAAGHPARTISSRHRARPRVISTSSTLSPTPGSPISTTSVRWWSRRWAAVWSDCAMWPRSSWAPKTATRR